MNEQEEHIGRQVEYIGTLEKISDEMFGNLVTAIGNNEAKAITLLNMRPGVIYSRMDLHRALTQAQGKQAAWKVANNVPFAYCEQSLAPIGLVTREVLDPNLNTFGYIISNFGKGIGIPLAALLVDFSSRYTPSLHEFFGSTKSTSKQAEEINYQEGEVDFKKRSPMLRVKLYWELATTDLPIRKTDLAREIGEDEKILTSHLYNISRFGIIQYLARTQDKPFSYYSLSAARPQAIHVALKGRRELTDDVYKIFEMNPGRELSLEECIEALKELNPQRKLQSASSLLAHVVGVLSHLRKTGYVSLRKFDQTRQSEIDLTPEQRAMIVELVTILDGVQRQDPDILQRGKDLVNDLITHPHKIAKVMQKAKEHSPGANSSSIQETGSLILSILTKQSGLSRLEIKRLLEAEYGKQLGLASVGNILGMLEKQGNVHSSSTSVKGAIKRWHISSANPQRL